MQIDPIELSVEIVPEPAGPVQVGTRILDKRKTPLGTQSFTMEVTELHEAARRVKDVASFETGSMGRSPTTGQGTSHGSPGS